MPLLRSLFTRFRNLFRSSTSLERELSDELQSHLQLHIDDNLRRGLAPGEARRQALLQLGGLEQTKESVRDRFRSRRISSASPALTRMAHSSLFAIRSNRSTSQPTPKVTNSTSTVTANRFVSPPRLFLRNSFRFSVFPRYSAARSTRVTTSPATTIS